ncbi:MAG: ABC transporter ATP-binding protein [Clostridia bacterium]|nr:ABC transporter ATP-binding protein [Clostridia bacterium]
MKLSVKIQEKRFKNKLIFENFSYEFQNKGLYAVIGESGRGKTTLLRLIAGLDKKFKGEIIGGGFNNVSVAFQEYRLFPALSALENITEATATSYETAENMLLELGFSKEDTLLRPSELSGGMKQRVSLARAFLKKTPILLLDEPTKELDAELKTKLYKLIENESKSRLVIFVSHNESDIKALNPTTVEL